MRMDVDAKAVEAAGACLQCEAPAPCVAACPRHSPIPDAMRLLARAVCAVEPRGVWLREGEGGAVDEVAQALWAAYW